MKKITLLFILFLGLQTAGFAQECLPNGISFATQEEIDNFQTNYPGCTEIEGDVTINGPFIYNLDSLSNINSIGGYLHIYSCIWLTNLDGLSNLTNIGTHLIISNTGITSLSPLQGLTIINGDLSIANNDSLTNLYGLENIKSVDGVYNEIYANNSLTNLSGLEGLTSINGNLMILINNSLVSLEGINSLASIGLNLGIFENESLTNLEGLSNLTNVGESLFIEDNAVLGNIVGLNKLSGVGENLRIINNDNLSNLSGLGAVNSIGGELNINSNDELMSLEGLGDFESLSVDSVQIFKNPKLSFCEIQGVCDYITSPGAIVSIYNNAPRCNTMEEVDSACQYANTPELDFSDYYSIYPVPATDKLHISAQDNATIDDITIYNQYGQRVIFIQSGSRHVDISILTPGLYIIEIQNGDIKLRDRFIVSSPDI